MSKQTDGAEYVPADNADEEYVDLFAEATKQEEPETEDSEIKDDPEEKEEEVKDESEVADEQETEDKEEPTEEVDDWRASLSDEAQEAFQALDTQVKMQEHKDRSANGRISALHKKLNDAQAALAAVKTEVPEKTSQPEEYAPAEFEIPESFANLTVKYPELASALKDYSEAARKADGQRSTQPKAEETGEQTTPDTPKVDEVALDIQRAKVADKYPDYARFTKSVFWGEYLDQLPPKLNAMANGDNADDLIYIMDQYVGYFNDNHPDGSVAQDKTKATAPANETESGGPSDSKTKRAQERRDRKKEEIAPEIGTGQRNIPDNPDTSTEGYDRDFATASRVAHKKRMTGFV